VTSGSPSPASQLRGLAAGSLTVALAAAAHGAAGGALPSGATAAELGLLAVTIGALSATIVGGERIRGQLALLSAGQLLGHVLLGTVGHHHGDATGPSAAAMVIAHLVAMTCGAALIATAGYLCSALSRAVRAADPPESLPVTATPTLAFLDADQPLRSALLLAASMSHRGPPVGAVR
jgi:hypothetical protein